MGCVNSFGKSGIIPSTYRVLGKEASQQEYYLKFKAAYIHVVGVLTLFSLFFKMMIGFAVVASYLWIKGNNK